MSIDGANTSDFTVSAALGSTTLVPGATTTFAVTFAPTGLGARTATLHVASNDPDENAFDINLTGTGITAVTTAAVTGLSTTAATLNGSVNPGGLVTTAQFQYGLTTGYGSVGAVTLSPNNGTSAQSVNAALTGLAPNTTYHYRLSATNAGG